MPLWSRCFPALADTTKSLSWSSTIMTFTEIIRGYQSAGSTQRPDKISSPAHALGHDAPLQPPAVSFAKTTALADRHSQTGLGDAPPVQYLSHR
jgi:hypothetical protein